MTAKYITILSVLMVLSLVFTGSATEIHDSSGREPLLKDVTGQQLQDIIHSYQGKKAVLINVWATWCGPCVEEFPEIVKIQRKYQNRLRVIFVSADFPTAGTGLWLF